MPALATSVTKAATVATPTGAWNTPEQATNQNGQCASSNSGTLSLGTYNFAIPADAIITGVSVTLWATSPVGGNDTGLVLVRPGGSSTSRPLAAPTGSAFPFTCGSASVVSGVDGDLWGFTSPALSPADVNDATFGVQVTGTGDEGQAPYRLDAALITVFYTAAPPAAPTSLAAVSAQNEVSLTWVDNASDETSFSVERALDVPSPAFSEIGTSAANTPSFHDTTAACNTDYLYRVRAFRLGDNTYSTYSNTDSVTHACPDLTVSKSASAFAVIVNQPWTGPSRSPTAAAARRPSPPARLCSPTRCPPRVTAT